MEKMLRGQAQEGEPRNIQEPPPKKHHYIVIGARDNCLYPQPALPQVESRHVGCNWYTRVLHKSISAYREWPEQSEEGVGQFLYIAIGALHGGGTNREKMATPDETDGTCNITGGSPIPAVGKPHARSAQVPSDLSSKVWSR